MLYDTKRNVVINRKIGGSVPKIVAQQPRKFKSNGLGKFEYATYEKVPSGKYFSKIVRAEHSTTKSGAYAIEICYELTSFDLCYKMANGLCSEDETKKGVLCIKTKLSENSPYYQAFLDSMSEALSAEGVEFELEDIIGVTEHIELTYNGDYVNITKRFPYEFEWYKEDLKIDDED